MGRQKELYGIINATIFSILVVTISKYKCRKLLSLCLKMFTFIIRSKFKINKFPFLSKETQIITFSSKIFLSSARIGYLPPRTESEAITKIWIWREKRIEWRGERNSYGRVKGWCRGGAERKSYNKFGKKIEGNKKIKKTKKVSFSKSTQGRKYFHLLTN